MNDQIYSSRSLRLSYCSSRVWVASVSAETLRPDGTAANRALWAKPVTLYQHAGPWKYASDRDNRLLTCWKRSRVVVAASKVGVVCDSLDLFCACAILKTNGHENWSGQNRTGRTACYGHDIKRTTHGNTVKHCTTETYSTRTLSSFLVSVRPLSPTRYNNCRFWISWLRSLVGWLS